MKKRIEKSSSHRSVRGYVNTDAGFHPATRKDYFEIGTTVTLSRPSHCGGSGGWFDDKTMATVGSLPCHERAARSDRILGKLRGSRGECRDGDARWVDAERLVATSDGRCAAGAGFGDGRTGRTRTGMRRQQA